MIAICCLDLAGFVCIYDPTIQSAAMLFSRGYRKSFGKESMTTANLTPTTTAFALNRYRRKTEMHTQPTRRQFMAAAVLAAMPIKQPAEPQFKLGDTVEWDWGRGLRLVVVEQNAEHGYILACKRLSRTDLGGRGRVWDVDTGEELLLVSRYNLLTYHVVRLVPTPDKKGIVVLPGTDDVAYITEVRRLKLVDDETGQVIVAPERCV